MPELQPQDIERVMHGNEDLMQLSHYVDPHMLDRYPGLAEGHDKIAYTPRHAQAPLLHLNTSPGTNQKSGSLTMRAACAALSTAESMSGGSQSQSLTTSPVMGLARLAHLPRK